MRAIVDKICENCSTEFSIRRSDSNRGRGRFCGKSCAASGSNNSAYKHGDSPSSGMSKEYRTWAGIVKRVTNANAENYRHYGGRGIGVCDRWSGSYANFLEDMGRAPSLGHSIERIDNDGNYEPGNCRWATRAEQSANRRTSVLLSLNGTTRAQEEWGSVTGIGGLAIHKRLKRGWSVERALTVPPMR